MSDGQSRLDRIPLLLYGIRSFAVALAGAAQALRNNGFQNGRSVVVTGLKAVVHLDQGPVRVILLTNVVAG